MPIISLNRTWIVRGLTLSAGLLVVAGFSVRLAAMATGRDSFYGLLRLLDLDMEGNLPTFFSSSILLIAAALLAAIATVKRQGADPDASRWTVLATGFVCMAADEAAGFHEILDEPMRAIIDRSQVGIFYFAWIVPALALLAALGIYFVGFVRRLPAPTRRLFTLGAVVYLSGAVGLEMAGGQYLATHGESRDLTYVILASIEEGLEMAGSIVFIRALLNYLADNWNETRVRVT